VLVIAMGDAALNPGAPAATADAEGKDKAADSSTVSFLVTVAVTPTNAARLIHGINNGTLYAALRSADLKMAATPRVDDLNIFDLSGLGK
jgi:pilus assembly protein CpaB